ncbi:MAG: PrsW family intramembrane metalloprotease [Candidatus Pacebacteria bacterium]|nr:PrsW family intramembrane metalloprotease [Candidatus Paceibacterota bacterium]MCF7857584.1 PrsW family intramembrane metalloprotease [Candidatus Paceibacterota bacterium]
MQSMTFAIAFLAGLIPALFWLWFWLREDKASPEPKILIATSFIAGMLIVPLVLPLQQFAMQRFAGDNLIFVWVIIEEVFKYSAALIVILWNKAVDEPLDAIIYMITIALGFSALENAFFIFNPLVAGDYVNSLLTGNFRFLGATLLHVLASGTVGVAMALSYYKRDSIKILSATTGLFIAIILHAIFNFTIMDASGETVLGVFMFVWMGIIVLFLLFERVKLLEKIHRRIL